MSSDKCPDCQVSPGERHHEGCDVSRCSLHGYQAISCDFCLDEDFEDQFNVSTTIWTGEWPGIEECHELDLWVWDFPGIPGKSEDLNRLQMMGFMGQVVWDQEKEKWVRPE